MLPILVLVVLVAAAAAAPVQSGPDTYDSAPSSSQVAPVLDLPWDQLLGATPVEVRPIASTFDSWDQYMESFRAPALEELRASLARTLNQDTWTWHRHEVPRGRSYRANSDLIAIADPERLLTNSDIVLVTQSSTPEWRRDSCGLVFVAYRDRPDIVACSVHHLELAVGHPVYMTVVGSATTTLRIIESLQLRRDGGELFREVNLQPTLIDTLLANGLVRTEPRPAAATTTDLDRFVGHLNKFQRGAVLASLDETQRPGSTVLIQGPPGTGKSTCVVSLLRVLLSRSKRVLLTAPTNVAVLDVAKRLIRDAVADGVASESILILVGTHRDKVKGLIDDSIRDYIPESRAQLIFASVCDQLDQLRALIDHSRALRTLDYQSADPNWALVDAAEQSARTKIHTIERSALTQIREFVASHTFRSSLECLRQIGSALDLLANVDSFDEAAILIDRMERSRNVLSVGVIESELLKKASLIFTTLSGTKRRQVLEFPFEVAVVDECAQAVEAEMLALFKSTLQTLVLVGDPQQLPATVFQSVAAHYQRSLFERLCATHPVHLLALQYRMHPSISAFPNSAFYDRRIQDHSSVSVESPAWITVQFPVVQFIAHYSRRSLTNPTGSSFNDVEAQLITSHLEKFLRTVPNERLRIGVIAPYTAQRLKLTERIGKLALPAHVTIDVNTVDGFQGQECDVIIISLTETTNPSEFLNLPFRMNVAVTRAKHALWLFGHGDLFLKSSTSVWNKFAAYCRRQGALLNLPRSSFGPKWAKRGPKSANSAPVWTTTSRNAANPTRAGMKLSSTDSVVPTPRRSIADVSDLAAQLASAATITDAASQRPVDGTIAGTNLLRSGSNGGQVRTLPQQ